jgi:folate-dependent phosphoribosylglycinamide formyltransferase PurN
MYRIGWFSSGTGAGSRGLFTTVMNNIISGNINASVIFVFCNREPGQSEETDKFHKLVKSYDIPLIYYSSRRFEPNLRKHNIEQWRDAYDIKVIERLADYSVDLSVLAGYMLVTGKQMCHKYNQLNLHPAIPGGPIGTWKEVIWQLIEHNASEAGAMMHLATPELDEGPPVTYCKFSIRGQPFDTFWNEIDGKPVAEIISEDNEENKLFKAIRMYGLMREYPLIVATIKAFSEGNLKIQNDKVLDGKGNTRKGYDLSREIDRSLKEQGLI